MYPISDATVRGWLYLSDSFWGSLTAEQRKQLRDEVTNCPEYCPNTKTHIHIPDKRSLRIDDAFVNVDCSACGRTGCAGKFDPEKIDW
jgi:hypothetical protein